MQYSNFLNKKLEDCSVIVDLQSIVELCGVKEHSADLSSFEYVNSAFRDVPQALGLLLISVMLNGGSKILIIHFCDTAHIHCLMILYIYTRIL